MLTPIRIGNKTGTRIFATAMLLPAIILLVLLELYPFLTAVYTSFTSFHTITRKQSFIGLAHYRDLLTDPLFLQSIWRSMLWTFSVLIATLVIGIAFSLILHAELRGRNVARGLVLYPYLVPAIVAALSWRFMLAPATGIINYVLVDQLGVLDYPINWLGDPKMAMPAVIIVGIWKYIPFMVILFLARLQTTPLDLYDAAKIDGANGFQVFWYITLPWLTPTIIIATLLRTNWLFNHFNTHHSRNP
jgi:multiple sugar transport system permease protein